MKKKSMRRKRRSRAEWSALVREWKDSGRGAEAFARGRDFSACSLYTWRKKLDPPEDDEMALLPLVIDDDAAADADSRWEIYTDRGVMISMAGPRAVEALEVALRTVSDWKTR